MFFQGWKARAYKGMAPQRQDQEQSRRNARFRCMYETTVKRTDGQELRRKELGSNFLGAGLSVLATVIGLIVLAWAILFITKGRFLKPHFERYMSEQTLRRVNVE